MVFYTIQHLALLNFRDEVLSSIPDSVNTQLYLACRTIQRDELRNAEDGLSSLCNISFDFPGNYLMMTSERVPVFGTGSSLAWLEVV